jgi:hypothetical protein
MSKWQTITASYSELTDDDFGRNGSIELHDDGDGVDYIARWDYSKPIPDGLKLGK